MQAQNDRAKLTLFETRWTRKRAQFLQDLQLFIITVNIEGVDQVFSTVIDRARFYQRSAYDASYLELAQRLGLPFATKDDPLRKAAGKLGAGICQPWPRRTASFTANAADPRY